jgi:CRP-like cAMP-binding protein
VSGLSRGGWESSGRQRHAGSLRCRLSRTHRRYKWLVRAFPDVSAAPLMEAASRLQRSRYRRGEVIVVEGETADRLFVITSGEAEVIQWTADRDVYIRTLRPGDFFGEVGLLTSEGRSATVRAVGNVKALTLDERAFSQLVRRSESTAAGLAQLLQVRSVRATPRVDAVPLPAWTKLMQRVFKHPRLRHYNRLIALVIAVNVALLWFGLARGIWWSGKSPQLNSLALVAVTNFGLAIILRQQYVINFLCWLGGLPPTSWPLRLRWMFGKYYHFG